jgi:hypothetical protein
LFHKGFLWENLKERDNIEDVSVYESIIKYILNKLDGRGGLASSGSEYRKEAGLYEHGNEPSVFKKCMEFLN